MSTTQTGRSARATTRKSGRKKTRDRGAWLPTCRADMLARGWDQIDVLLVSGDAYADHPAFGIPLLGRVLERAGYRVGIVAQPDWRSTQDVTVMGRPRLFCGISAGCLDSMVAHYTAFRKKRHDDAYTPGGKAGARPNRACLVYSNLVHQAFPGLPVVLGGIEASCRRLAHYDFWTDAIRRSILLDAKADLLLYGMAERGIVEVARRIANGESLETVPGSAVLVSEQADALIVPSFEDVQAHPAALMDVALTMESHVQAADRLLAQRHGNRFVILNPPARPLSTDEFDALYDLPFTREAHPGYSASIPALDMVRWSVTAVRGCGGGCSFCSLALHQGRRIRSRSVESVLREVRAMATDDQWTGSISDVGGPTANLWGAACTAEPTQCPRHSCLFPRTCPHLRPDQEGYAELLSRVKAIRGVKHVRVASGIRHDLALEAPEAIAKVARDFVGGQLKLAPEHRVDHVLALMRKTDFSLFERFVRIFQEHSGKRGHNRQYIVPYIMSAFPGCTMEDMQRLAAWFRERGWRPQQVQCFLPTPGTVATAMFHAGCDTEKRPIHVARTDREREDQHAILVPKRKQSGRRPRRRQTGGKR